MASARAKVPHLARLKCLVRLMPTIRATHTESVTRYASNGFSIIRFACLFMAKAQFQSAATAQKQFEKYIFFINIQLQ